MKSMTAEMLSQCLFTQYIHNVTPFDFQKDRFHIFDFTQANEELQRVDLNSKQAFEAFIFNKIEQQQCTFGVGQYNEDRFIYSRSEVFGGDENRTVHLGIDIWSAAGTPVYAPLPGVVHSFKDNNSHGDYGPTIILEHTYKDHKFHTLYGHLSKSSLDDLYTHREIKAGEHFANYGTYAENLHWPPHLHFQLILDIGMHVGDYPGVCRRSEREGWLSNCPDPNLILQLPLGN